MQKASLLKVAAVATAVAFSGQVPAQSPSTTDDIAAIAQEAYLYGLPMVMLYSIMYEYAIDEDSGQYKAPFNTIANEPRVYTPADTAVVTPNSDTPYSFLWMDLRAEPMVLCVPEIEPDRYYSVMLTSQYTFNFGYIGTRTTGNGAGCYAVAGPSWTGTLPAGIDKLFTSETDFALATYRTQLFEPSDISNVKAIQAKYQATGLSVFLGSPKAKPTPAVNWPKIDKQSEKAEFFDYLAFLLQYAPATGSAAVEVPLRDKFAMIGIRAGRPFPSVSLTAADKAAIAAAAGPAESLIEEKLKTIGQPAEGWLMVTSGIGDRAVYNGDWVQRAAVARGGILANDPAEAVYAITRHDKDNQPLDGATANYTLTFPEGALPPVHAFWSVTMYDGRSQLLIKNPIKRYLINSAMLPDLEKNADGSLTLYIQNGEPTEPAQKANWLPAPDGPIYMVLRLYWPQEAALDGSWLPPGLQRAPEPN
ncbi:MAG: DUF1254 domain-containing protein [Halioglobus sp.]|nr:DUF1254 domain-containing protein [Halioglobus sp.]